MLSKELGDKAMGFNQIDGIVYINLDSRKDRKKQILKEINDLKIPKEKIHRIQACYSSLNGHYGCSLSHLAAIDLAIKKNWEKVLILEDDCVFSKKNEIDSFLTFFFKKIKKWDVLFLGAKVYKTQETELKDINKVIKATYSHCYLVNKNYLSILANIFFQSSELLKDKPFLFYTNYAIDRLWLPLQIKDNWFISSSLFAKQRASYSDTLLKKLPKR